MGGIDVFGGEEGERKKLLALLGLEADPAPALVDLTPLVAQRQELQGAWINFNRYSSAVRSSASRRCLVSARAPPRS